MPIKIQHYLRHTGGRSEWNLVFRTKHMMHPERIEESSWTPMDALCAVFQRRFGCDELLFVRLTVCVTRKGRAEIAPF